MRFERLENLLRLAIRLQGVRGGLTIADIEDEFNVSRRTAERMRDAVEEAFGPLETVDADTGDRRKHWRLQSPDLLQFIRVSPEELAELEAAAGSLDRAGLAERAGGLRELAAKLRAVSRGHSPEEFKSALEAHMEAEGLAMRPGDRNKTSKRACSRSCATPSRRAARSSSTISPGRRDSGAASASSPTGCSTATARSWWGRPTGRTIRGFGGLRT